MNEPFDPKAIAQRAIARGALIPPLSGLPPAVETHKRKPDDTFKSTPGPTKGHVYKSPYVPHPTGRVAVLEMIEGEILREIELIESGKSGHSDMVGKAMVSAFQKSIRICRDYHVLNNGKPVRNSRE